MIDTLAAHHNLPQSGQYRGLKFVLQTASPPALSDEIIERPLVFYRTVRHPWSPLINLVKRPSLHFIFLKSTYHDEEGVEFKVALTRELLSIAWIDGYNGMRYHTGLLEYLRRTMPLQNINRDFSITLNRLEVISRNWSMRFREVDLALGFLTECEQTCYVPESWTWPGTVNILDLDDSSVLQDDSTKDQLTPVCLHAAARIIRLEQAGYLAEFVNLAEASGFRSPAKYQIYGLSEFQPHFEPM